MALEAGHLKEVGVVGYPDSVVVPVAKAAAAPAAAPAAAGGKAAAGEDKAVASGKKEKGGKPAKDAKAPAAAVPAGPPPAEKSAAELAKLSKEERTQYHLARRAAPSSGAAGSKDGAAAASATAPAQLTKAQRRALQDNQRKVKEDKATSGKEGDELLNELKLQGLSEDQALQVMLAIKSGEVIPEDDSEDDNEPDDLLGSVRKWMAEQLEGPLPDDAMRDFNMKVRFQGHVNTTPPDHLAALLTVLLEQAFGGCDLAAPKLQPGAVAKAFTQVAERWASLLRTIYSKIPDVLDAVGAVIGTISQCVVASGAPPEGQDKAVVGCLMAIRELEDLVEDEDLLMGCKGIEPRSRVLEKFIEFLEEALEEDDSEGESDKE